MAKAKAPESRLRRELGYVVPTNWLDPMLTGPKAVIGSPPYNCQDIERLLEAVRKRLASTVEANR